MSRTSLLGVGHVIELDMTGMDEVTRDLIRTRVRERLFPSHIMMPEENTCHFQFWVDGTGVELERRPLAAEVEVCVHHIIGGEA